MTNIVYFAGGEDTSGIATGTVTTSLSNFRAGFARCSLAPSAVGSTNDPPTAMFTLLGFLSPQSTFWLHFHGVPQGAATTASSQWVMLLDGTTSRISLRGTGTSGQIKISKRNAAGTFTDLATGTSGAITAAAHEYDIFVNYSTSGQITVYQDGIVIADTGSGVDVTTDSATTLSNARFTAFSTVSATFFSEFLVMDSDTRGTGLWTLTPTAAGNTQSWTPNTVANINKSTINDATNVTTPSNNALSEWTTPTSAPSGTWAVLAVVQEARVEKGASGPTSFEWLCRTIDGTDHVSGSISLTTSFVNYGNQIWATNPHTATTWATSDIATGFNLGIESLA